MSTKNKMENEHLNLAHGQRYLSHLEKIIQDGICPFCVDFSDENKSPTYHNKPVIMGGKCWAVTENMFPYDGATLHLMLVSREHWRFPSEITDEAKIEYFDLVARIEKEFKIKGGIHFMRFGETEMTGSSVSHLHAQLVVGTKRFEGADPLVLYFGYKQQK